VASADTVAGGAGRRDEEKIGRSRVLDKVASEIAQSGLALSSLGSAEVGAATPSEIVSISASRMAGLCIISAAVMSYRTHPETAAQMRRVPTSDTAKPPDRAVIVPHTLFRTKAKFSRSMSSLAATPGTTRCRRTAARCP